MINKKNRGFTLTLDMVLGIIIVLGVLVYSGIGLQNLGIENSSMQIKSKQILDDALTAIDNNGYLGKILVDETSNITDTEAEKIYLHLKDLLPKNLEANITIYQYESKGEIGEDEQEMNNCRDKKTFADCFESPPTLIEAGETIPTDREIYKATQTFMKRQPVEKGTEDDQCIPGEPVELKEEKKEKKILLDTIQIITTKVTVKDKTGNNDLADMQCYEDPGLLTNNQVATIKLEAKSGIREPIAVMLAMDRSLSMNAYDMDYASIPAASLNEGTCNPSPCTSSATTNCGNYDYSPAGSFAIDSSTADAMQPYPSSLLQFLINSTSSGTCGTVPRLQAINPLQNPSTYNNNTYFVNVSKSHVALGETWGIEGWSDVTITNRIIYKRIYSALVTIQSGTLQGGTVAYGSGSECTGFDNWQNIGTIPIPNLTTHIYGRLRYTTAYAGNCTGAKVRICPPGTGPLDASCTEATCPSANSNCDVAKVYSLSTPAPSGNWTIYGWSDFPLAYTSSYYIYFYPSNYIALSGLTFSGGTCGGETCSQIAASCNSPTDYQTLGTITIPAEDDLLGIKPESSYSGYAGNCNYPIMRLKTPRVPDQYYTFSRSGTNFYYNCYASATIGRCQSSQNTSTWPKIMPGDWTVDIWADEETSFGQANFKIQRIDAAKRAAKNFLDNAEWKENDEFGMVSYSTDAVLANNPYQALTTEKETVKIRLNNLHPEGSTATGLAIEQATAMLSTTKKKYMIILTDGKANIPGASEWESAQYAITAANTARALRITIYVIGFANLSEIQSLVDGNPSRTYESVLQEIAKDSDTIYCNGQYCGKYYYAATEEQLNELYDLIAEEIGTAIENTEIVVPAIEGIETCKCADSGCTTECDNEANWQTGETRFSGINLSGNYTARYYKARIACHGVYCLENYALFPPKKNILVNYQEQTYIKKETTVYDWGPEGTACGCTTECDNATCTKKIPLTCHDCRLIFTGGNSTVNNSTVNLEITCNFNPSGTQNLEIGFYQDRIPDGEHATVTNSGSPSSGTTSINNPDLNLAWQGTITANNPVTIENVTIDKTGYIWGLLSGAKDCTRWNKAVIYCLGGESKIYFYKVEYSTWAK